MFSNRIKKESLQKNRGLRFELYLSSDGVQRDLARLTDYCCLLEPSGYALPVRLAELMICQQRAGYAELIEVGLSKKEAVYFSQTNIKL